MQVVKRDGTLEGLDVNKVHKCISWACEGLENVSVADVETNAHVQFFDGITTEQIHSRMIQSAAELISIESPDYEYVAARLLLQQIVKECGQDLRFGDYIQAAVLCGKVSNDLVDHYDYSQLNSAIDNSRNLKFKYLGLQTIYDRYLIRDNDNKVIESPQHFFMRVACGICLNEPKAIATEKVIELYELFSNFEYLHSTPTLFNSGTLHPQMSSCFLLTVDDSTIDHDTESEFGKGIMALMAEAAVLSKYAGGIGTDFTRIRPVGSLIKGTNGVSSGVVPALKIYNDTALFFNQGGKRPGSFASYLEPWHGDIEAYVDIKKPTGDARLRAMDIFPYLWMNDLFLERVKSKAMWSLFDVSKFPELHDLYGVAFKARYEELESQGLYIRKISAMDLWVKSVTSLVETGAPMIAFKDEANRRNPQRHVGTIKSSNLCSEIFEVTSDEETAVCNLSSLNLARLEFDDIKRVVPIAIRALDNVIDSNFYPSDKSKVSNLRHRPIGLGVMGWAEYLIKHDIDFESQHHLDECDRVWSEISYWAIHTSCELSKEKGRYSTFEGSDWSKGILPYMTHKDYDNDTPKWIQLSKDVMQYGVRNSLMLALAPTASISCILGTTPSIEVAYKLAYLKDNLSGKFMVIDPTLRYNKPAITKTAFEIDQVWAIKAAAVRQKWIDQGQSLNLYKAIGTRGSTISNWFMLANELGLKSTYYLKNQDESVKVDAMVDITEEVKFCSIENSECESCQ